MERARLRALTPFEEYFSMLRMFRRNGESPIKGIDTIMNSHFHFRRCNRVEMERARLRALTHHYLSLRKNGPPCKVEMERARLRALTHLRIVLTVIDFDM